MNKVQALIDLNNKINAIMLVYALKLAFQVRRTNVKAQKIDGSILKIFKIALANF